MMTTIVVRLLVLGWMLLAPAVARSAAEGDFSFYGLRLGMQRADAAKVVELQGDTVKAPSHGMSELELVFDRENALMEIRASWPRPAEPLELQGLQRALREKFVAPVTAAFPTVSVSVDEYGNRAALRVVFLSTTLRERSIDFYRARFRKTLD
jgi:hypothetical protein